MSEVYLHAIRDSFSGTVTATFNTPMVGGEVLERSLALRQEPTATALQDVAADSLDMETLSPENRLLFRYRVLGGMATRVALGSYWAAKKGADITPFFELSDRKQADMLNSATDAFSQKIAGVLERRGQGVEYVLAADKKAARLCASADPSKVPHSFVRQQLHGYKREQLSRSDRLQRLKYYANIGVGSFSGDDLPDATVGVNDSVLVQAFGRNHIEDKDLPKIREVYDEEAGGDDIAMWRILDSYGFDPGDSNEALAHPVAARVAGNGAVIEAPIQWEVAYAFWKLHPEAYEQRKHYVHTLWPKTGFYPTIDVKADSIEVMDRIGLYNPQELAHPDMLIRAMGILSKLGVEADAVAADVPFDSRSVQKQIQSEGAWKRREALTRIHHLMLGKVKF